ncbi:glycoside hydrolase family 15 protein [Spirillospora sp. NBC_00431]
MTSGGSRDDLGNGLAAHSLAVLREGQHPSGAFVACPGYPIYQYAWLRDGSFCAYAMDVSGEHDSAAAFHRFVASTIRRNLGPGTSGEKERRLPARYTLTGELERLGEEDWPNFQLDGYGTWLWTLRDHRTRGGTLDTGLLDTAGRTADYLAGMCHLPCYDCWEESGDRRHTSTLAAIIAGLEAAADLLDRQPLMDRAASLRRELDSPAHLRDGGYVKHDASGAVDASLLWLSLPFGVVAADDPRMAKTAERIGAELTGPGGGIRRYLGDEFYGGGEWTLLTAWWGWYRAVLQDARGAREAARWVEAAATERGDLPEQLTDHPQFGDRVEPWERKWGPVATPLLWSHAMYLVLDDALARL